MTLSGSKSIVHCQWLLFCIYLPIHLTHIRAFDERVLHTECKEFIFALSFVDKETPNMHQKFKCNYLLRKN